MRGRRRKRRRRRNKIKREEMERKGEKGERKLLNVARHLFMDRLFKILQVMEL